MIRTTRKRLPRLDWIEATLANTNDIRPHQTIVA